MGNIPMGKPPGESGSAVAVPGRSTIRPDRMFEPVLVVQRDGEWRWS